MNQKLKGAVIFASGLISGTIIGSGFVVKQILGDDDYRDVVKKKIVNKINVLLYGEERVNNNKTTPNRSGYTVEEILFPSRTCAEEVLNKMINILVNYGFVSVSDYYVLSNVKPKSYHDTKYGWTTLKDVNIICNGNGFSIDLTRPTLIER